MTHSELLQIIVEAEARVKDVTSPDDVRIRSQENLDLCNERLRLENMTYVSYGGDKLTIADVVQINSDGTERKPYTEAY